MGILMRILIVGRSTKHMGSYGDIQSFIRHIIAWNTSWEQDAPFMDCGIPQDIRYVLVSRRSNHQPTGVWTLLICAFHLANLKWDIWSECLGYFWTKECGMAWNISTPSCQRILSSRPWWSLVSVAYFMITSPFHGHTWNSTKPFARLAALFAPVAYVHLIIRQIIGMTHHHMLNCRGVDTRVAAVVGGHLQDVGRPHIVGIKPMFSSMFSSNNPPIGWFLVSSHLFLSRITERFGITNHSSWYIITAYYNISIILSKTIHWMILKICQSQVKAKVRAEIFAALDDEKV